jgi:hypothetical protein
MNRKARHTHSGRSVATLAVLVTLSITYGKLRRTPHPRPCVQPPKNMSGIPPATWPLTDGMRRPFSGTVGLRAVTATKEDGTWNSSPSDAIWEIAGLKSDPPPYG